MFLLLLYTHNVCMSLSFLDHTTHYVCLDILAQCINLDIVYNMVVIDGKMLLIFEIII